MSIDGAAVPGDNGGGGRLVSTKVRAVVSGMLLLACTQRVEVVVEGASEVGAHRVELRVYEAGGCDEVEQIARPPVWEAAATAGSTLGEGVELDGGEYVATARAFTGACFERARACTPFVLPRTDPVRLDLAAAGAEDAVPALREECVTGEVRFACAEGACVPAGAPACGGSPATLVAVFGGGSHVLASTPSGIRAFGDNTDGQLDPSSGADALYISEVTAAAADALATGADHSCAIVGGALECWGEPSRGQLGDTNDVLLDALGRVARFKIGIGTVAVTAWIDVAAGDGFTCGIVEHLDRQTDGGVGSDAGVGGATFQRTLVCFGLREMTAQTLPHGLTVPRAGITGWDAIGAGALDVCARDSERELYCWTRAALALGATPTASDVELFALGRGSGAGSPPHDVLCTIDGAGALVCTELEGDGDGLARRTPIALPELPARPSGVAVGEYGACAIFDGEVRCFAIDGSAAELPAPDSGLPIVEVDVGAAFACARTIDGQVLCPGMPGENLVAPDGCPRTQSMVRP